MFEFINRHWNIEFPQFFMKSRDSYEAERWIKIKFSGEFVHRSFRELMEEHGIRHYQNQPVDHSTMGLTERFIELYETY